MQHLALYHGTVHSLRWGFLSWGPPIGVLPEAFSGIIGHVLHESLPQVTVSNGPRLREVATGNNQDSTTSEHQLSSYQEGDAILAGVWDIFGLSRHGYESFQAMA
jgi:hypothetical protein